VRIGVPFAVVIVGSSFADVRSTVSFVYINHDTLIVIPRQEQYE